MSTDLPKTYDPASVEPEANRVWTDERLFHAEPTDPGEPYAIVIPPPNVTAALHLGHALNNTLQDILTRQHRMNGDNAVWIPGTDHAGIATQAVVDKRLQAEGKPALKDYKVLEAEGKGGREQFVAKVQAWKDEYEERITDQLKRMGCSCDWQRQAFTMDEPRVRAVREAFFQLFKDGLIYRGKRLVNWDPVSQTALADDEVENEEIDGNFYYLRYLLVGGERDEETERRRDEVKEGTAPSAHSVSSSLRLSVSSPHYITVATTRPETMLGDTAVAMNPKDPRAAQLRGRKVVLPIVNREIPIIEDDYVVLPVSMGGDEKDPKAQFATGFLKVTPAHDPNDYDIGQRHALPMINVFSPTASISKDHGWPADDFARGDAFLKEQLAGKDRFEARKLIVKWFKDAGLLEEIKPYRHSVGHSYRSHVPIEPWLSDQWYCKVTDDRLAGAALRAIAPDQRSGAQGDTGLQPVPAAQEQANDSSSPESNRQHGLQTRVTAEHLRFYPARYAKTFQTWHENIRDWCISRQLWWGHRIPVWRLPEGRLGDRFSPEAIATLITKMTKWASEGRMALRHRGEGAGAREEDVTDPMLPFAFACVRDAADREIIDELERHGAVQDPDVLDTWFSSALWPMSTLGWPDESQISDLKSALSTWNPTSVLCTAREIITLWVSRMVMFNLYFLGRLPFRDVFIHAMIQDGHGQKMSKSLGNGVDPVDIIHSHGSDAMRFTLASMATNTQDVRMPVDMVDPHSGKAFTPKYVADSAGHMVAAPVQESPDDPKKKMVSSYGVASGKAAATPEMPVARNTSSKFDLGRNFCNKLWNAARFSFANMEKAGVEPVDERKWTVADRWIVSRFNRTVEEANRALADYRFDQYAKACYDFFWRDFCDWYLEVIKPAMRDAARTAQTANVLASVFDGSLRLMHPLIPFITETIWWRLNDVRPQRGLPNRLECPPSERLIRAAWPRVGDCSEASEFIFPKLQEVIGAIRNLRNQHNVKPSQSVTVSILAPAEASRSMTDSREIIETLATCTLKAVGPDLTPPQSAARVSAAGCEIFVEGMVDEAAEQQRVGKRREELTKQIAAMKGRLSNESYIAKAPPHLVKQTRDQLAEAEAELAKLSG